MVKVIGTSRRKTKHEFRKGIRKKGKISLRHYFQSFNQGENVILSVEPSVHKGMYFPRFLGLQGVIKRKNGTCYEVKIHDHTKEKTLIVHPVHLRRVEK